MYLIGGGFGGPGCPSRGQFPRAAKNPLKPPPPPKAPPFLNLAVGGFRAGYPISENPPPPRATQLLMSLDLQLLHTPCDSLLHKEVNTPSSHTSAHTPHILNYDSDASAISARHSSVSSASSASTDISAPRKHRRFLHK